MIHKEKIARREIGILTTSKNTTRMHKILAPSNQEKPIKYIRKPIDYTILDGIGHGVRSTSNTPRSKRTIPPAQQNIINGTGTSAGPAPTSKPPTPPQPIRAGGSLSRGTASKEYRTPAPPIAPPTVPSNYAPNYPIGYLTTRGQDIRKASGYSTLPMASASQAPQGVLSSQPQIGMVHPMTHGGVSTSHGQASSIPPPPNMSLDKLPGKVFLSLLELIIFVTSKV